MGVSPMGRRSASVLAPSFGMSAIKVVDKILGQTPVFSTRLKNSARDCISWGGKHPKLTDTPRIRAQSFPWVHMINHLHHLWASDRWERRANNPLKGFAFVPVRSPRTFSQKHSVSQGRWWAKLVMVELLHRCASIRLFDVFVNCAFRLEPIGSAPLLPFRGSLLSHCGLKQSQLGLECVRGWQSSALSLKRGVFHHLIRIVATITMKHLQALPVGNKFMQARDLAGLCVSFPSIWGAPGLLERSTRSCPRPRLVGTTLVRRRR